MQNLSNTSLGQYQLSEVVGRGRMSTVYKAYQPSLHRFVAIKVFQNLDLLGAARFEREAQVVARLHHPNILPIFDYGQQGELRYFVTQYIENSVTLSDLLAQGRSEPIAALDMIRHLLAGLAYAHTHGVIHRDIKPSNILLPAPSWPLLADFGIAKLLDDLRQLTPPGQTVGTAAYMAPELARGQLVDARADLYSVGVVLYELLTGRAPFEAITPAAVLNLHIHAAPPSPRSLNQDLSAEVETLLLRALAKDPAARYQSADEMAQDLERVAAQLERQRTLVALLDVPAPAAVAHTTRKLAPGASPAERSTQHVSARDLPAGRGTAHTSSATSRGNSFRAAWGIGPLFMAVVAVSLIGGMLAAHFLRRYAPGAEPRPEPTTTQTTRTLTPLAAEEQDLHTGATVLPADLSGSENQQPLLSTEVPTVLEQPPPEQTSPALPPIESTDTAVPLDPPVPTLDPPLVPTVPTQPEPSAAEPTPAPPEAAPTDALAPSSVSE
ncbi:MAG TPA: serine/threonine-protein kinase [Herpetosiphonaceae bacterium]